MKTVAKGTLILVLLSIVLASDAFAQRVGGGYEWIDDLRGPGPFTGYSGFVGFCLGRAPFTGCDRTSRNWINLKASRTRSEAGPKGESDFPEIVLWTVEPSIDLRALNVVDNRFFIELGYAAGLHHFEGAESFDPFWRFSLTPIRVGAIARPRDWLQAELRFSVSYIFGELTAEDFGARGDYATGGQWNPSWFIGLSVIP